MKKLLLLGLDGATLDVVRPLAAAGRLPSLARWLAEGAAAPLSSTTPPMSFPAWSTFATGRDPGEHGIFDFTQKLEGAYRLRFVNAADRSGETIFGRASRAGARVLCLGVPATYPPEPVNGLLVSGFDAPVSRGTDDRHASDPALYRAVAARTGPWMTADLDETARDDGWHERAIGVLLARIERKTAFALEALRAVRAARPGAEGELACVVFSESDTVAHHYWRDFDAASPRHDPAASPARRDALAAVYARLDEACARLHEAAGEDARCLVVSDHGSGGASRRIVHLGRRLAETGLLRRRAARAGGALDALARGARDGALRVLPARAAEALFRRARGAAARVESAARFGGIDWRHTAAFSEDVNTQPGVWINLRGREAQGSVPPADYERVRQEVIDALADWKAPGGGPVVARARRREEVYSGPHLGRAPDVVIELADDGGYGLSAVPTPWSEGAGPSVRTLAREEWGGGRGRGMNGTHRPDGLALAPDAASAEAFGLFRAGARPRLVDVAPAVLRALGVAPAPDDTAARSAPTPYAPDDEAVVAARLRALGYLE